MFNADNYFCCKCGRNKAEEYKNDEGNYKTRINDFTLIDGSIVCKQCWFKNDFICKDSSTYEGDDE